MRYHYNNNVYLDLHTIKQELEVKEVKLLRTIHKLKIAAVQYKNIYLINEVYITKIADAIKN